MIRTFVTAFITIVAISAGLLEAQSTGAPGRGPRIPVSVVGGTPGVSIEFFMDAGKLADATLDATGGMDWVLDLANRGKTRVTIYVDVCKDGKIVKVMFVTGSGAPPPEADDCDRRLAAVSFQTDCGVTRITLNFANFGASVIGCGGLSFRDPKVIGATAGGAVLVALLSGGGGDSTPSSTATPTTTTTTPPVTALPPIVSPPVTSTPPVVAPQPPANLQGRFVITLVVHGTNTSRICGVVQHEPIVPGATFVITATGPAVLPGQTITGTFNSNGQGVFSVGIGNFGVYTLAMAMSSPNGGTGSATTTVNVNSSGVVTCPSLTTA